MTTALVVMTTSTMRYRPRHGLRFRPGRRIAPSHRYLRPVSLVWVVALMLAGAAPASLAGPPLQPIAATRTTPVASPAAAAGSASVVAVAVLRARHARQGHQLKREPRVHARTERAVGGSR